MYQELFRNEVEMWSVEAFLGFSTNSCDGAGEKGGSIFRLARVDARETAVAR